MSLVVQLLVGFALSVVTWMIRNPTATNFVTCAVVATLAVALVW